MRTQQAPSGNAVGWNFEKIFHLPYVLSGLSEKSGIKRQEQLSVDEPEESGESDPIDAELRGRYPQDFTKGQAVAPPVESRGFVRPRPPRTNRSK